MTPASFTALTVEYGSIPAGIGIALPARVFTAKIPGTVPSSSPLSQPTARPFSLMSVPYTVTPARSAPGMSDRRSRKPPVPSHTTGKCWLPPGP